MSQRTGRLHAAEPTLMESEILNELRSIRTFQTLSEDAIQQVALFSSIRLVRRGETVFCQGEPSPYCFLVASGEILVQHVSKTGQKISVSAPLKSGMIFGESALVKNRPRLTMASAHSDGKVIAIQSAKLRDWIEQHPSEAAPLLLAILDDLSFRQPPTDSSRP